MTPITLDQVWAMFDIPHSLVADNVRIALNTNNGPPAAMRVVYAVKIRDLPDPPIHPECPRTGWMHEGRPPWRVITFSEPGKAPQMIGSVVIYDGTEPTVSMDTLTAEIKARQSAASLSPIEAARELERLATDPML